MLENIFEIVLITYNRAIKLEKTLKQIASSPFKDCKFTVLDNCSTDDTSDVLDRNKGSFSEFKIIKNNINIGPSPNYLKAISLSESTYTWVICDDDEYDFSNVQDIIEAIESEQSDFIIIGDYLADLWLLSGKKSSVKKLIKEDYHYFPIHSFIPVTIFKTKLFDSMCFANGYKNVHNFYPNFPFLVKGVEEDFSVYFSQSRIVLRGKDDEFISGFAGNNIYIAWFKSCQFIKDKTVREKAIYDLIDNRNPKNRIKNLYFLSYTICISGKFIEERIAAFCILFAAFSFQQRIVLICAFLIGLTYPLPKFVCYIIKFIKNPSKCFSLRQSVEQQVVINDPFRF